MASLCGKDIAGQNLLSKEIYICLATDWQRLLLMMWQVMKGTWVDVDWLQEPMNTYKTSRVKKCVAAFKSSTWESGTSFCNSLAHSMKNNEVIVLHAVFVARNLPGLMPEILFLSIDNFSSVSWLRQKRLNIFFFSSLASYVLCIQPMSSISYTCLVFWPVTLKLDHKAITITS